MPIAVNRKTTKELRETLLNLLIELKELKQKEGYYLYIDHTVRLLKFLDIKKFMNDQKKCCAL